MSKISLGLAAHARPAMVYVNKGANAQRKKKMDEPTFWEKLIAFVLVVAGTGAAIWLGTHAVNAGISLLGGCK